MKRIDVEPIMERAKKYKKQVRVYLNGGGTFEINLRDVDTAFRQELLLITQEENEKIASIGDISYIEIFNSIKFQELKSNDREVVITEVNGAETFQIVPRFLRNVSENLMFEKKAVADYAVIFPLFNDCIETEDLSPEVYVFWNDEMIKLSSTEMFKFDYDKVEEYVKDTLNFLYFENIRDRWVLAGAGTQLETFRHGTVGSIGAELGVDVKKPIANLERVSTGIFKVMPTDYFCLTYHKPKPEKPIVDEIGEIERFFGKY